MKTLKINGHNGKTYTVTCHSRPDLLEKHANLIRKHEGGLIYTGPGLGLTFVINGMPHIMRVAPGYQWDGASIPKKLQWLIGKPTDYKFRLPSMFHDDGYEERSNRAINDVVFLYLLDVMGVKKWKVDLMYKGVRLGGHAYYASDTSKFWRYIKRLL